jgi:membrane-bound lytic murein transglycosylase D
MAIKIPKSKTLFINENLAWISDSLNSSPTNLLAGNSSIEITPVKTLVSEIKQTTTYRVKSGDVLSTIAAKNGITVTQLKAMNKLNSNIIRVGQTLVIKSTTDNKTLAENTSKTSSPRTYTVRPGDSLWIISKKIEGLTIEEIKRLNNLNGNNIKPGQKLIIG